MCERRDLGDLVPVVLNGPIPKTAGQRLVRGRGCAAGDPQRFDLVEGIDVPVAGQLWWSAGTKLVRGLQGKGSHARPMRKLGLLREIRRCGLVTSRCTAKNIRNGLRIGAVIATPG